MAASTNEARDKLGQLSTLLEYFNKASTNTGLAVRITKLTFNRPSTGNNGKMIFTHPE